MTRRKGFTLVELLVVIGIIALLISILLPSHMKAKRQAVWAQCSANLHNIGAALYTYASDNKGSIPQFFASPANLAYYDANRNAAMATWPTPSGFWMWDMEAPTRDAMVHYGATRNTLYCPSNPDMNVDGLWNFAVTTLGSPPTQSNIGYSVLGFVFLITRPETKIPGNFDYRDPTKVDDFGPNDHWNYQSSLKPHNLPAVANTALVRPDIASDTELACDAVVSDNQSPPASFGHIIGGFANGAVPTTSNHFYNGRPPTGGNILFMDGHVSLRLLRFPRVGNPAPGDSHGAESQSARGEQYLHHILVVEARRRRNRSGKTNPAKMPADSGTGVSVGQLLPVQYNCSKPSVGVPLLSPS